MMKRMRMLFIVCLVILSPLGTLFAQDMATAVETYNAGGKAIGENNNTEAIELFNKALTMLETISAEERGEEGDKMIAEAKKIIPQLHLRCGKELVNDKEYDKAIEELNKTIEISEKYGAAEVKSEATELIPQILMVSATALLSERKMEEAVAGFKKLLEIEPDNATANYRLGAAESGLGNEAGAIAAFEKAIELGDKNSITQLANVYLKRASAANTAKKPQEMFDNAVKADGYAETANSKKLAGLAALQLKKYDDTIKYLEAYLSISPNANDKNAMLYQIATAYEGKNDNAKACGYFKQIINDPKYKEIATYKVGQYKC